MVRLLDYFPVLVKLPLFPVHYLQDHWRGMRGSWYLSSGETNLSSVRDHTSRNRMLDVSEVVVLRPQGTTEKVGIGAGWQGACWRSVCSYMYCTGCNRSGSFGNNTTLYTIIIVTTAVVVVFFRPESCLGK